MITHTRLHSDGKSPITRVVRNPDEWELVEMDRDELTGETVLKYEREDNSNGGSLVATKIITRPSKREHTGWQQHYTFQTLGCSNYEVVVA